MTLPQKLGYVDRLKGRAHRSRPLYGTPDKTQAETCKNTSDNIDFKKLSIKNTLWINSKYV